MREDTNHHIEIDLLAMQIKIWDLGPKKPEYPKKPDLPPGREGSPEYDLAKIEFREALDKYEADLLAYRKQRAEFASWWAENGGPIQIEMWSVGAREAIERDSARYVFKLPEGMKPGPGHLRKVSREEQIAHELERARHRDPHFGKGVQAA